MKDLITLTITYDDNKREAMVLSKNSEAHRAMRAYAKQNDYAIDEKPYYDEKLMLWALRGILSTNRWEEIDILVDEYEIVKQALRSDNLDAHESHGLDIDPTPSDSEIKDAIFSNIEASDGDYRNQVWQAIMENINA